MTKSEDYIPNIFERSEARNKLKESEKSEKIRKTEKVFEAIIKLTIDNLQYKEKIDASTKNSLLIKTQRESVSSLEILEYLNRANAPYLEKEIKKIKENYKHSNEDNDIEKEKEISKVMRKYRFIKRTVQRILDDLLQKELIVRENDKYRLSNTVLPTLDNRYHASSQGYELLSALMKSHTPLYNTTQKNLKDLITFFGYYIILCFLEISKPIDDNYFKAIGYSPMSVAEKNQITETWLNNIVNVPLMYKHFIETFLNQPNDDRIRQVRKVKFKRLISDRETNKVIKYVYVDKQDNEYHNIRGLNSSRIAYVDEHGDLYKPDYQSLKQANINIPPYYHNRIFSDKADNEFRYELGEEMHKMITKLFEKTYPRIYRELKRDLMIKILSNEKTIQARTRKEVKITNIKKK
ncbi:MAG: hypothetical protein WKF36_10820 [Candidatus Nitrosocosmicus sp.]